MAQDYASLMQLWQYDDQRANSSQQRAVDVDDLPSAARSNDLAQKFENRLESLISENQEALHTDLIGRIHIMPAKFFEKLVIDVLLAMGYAGRRRDLTRHLGKSHDEGVDGVIALDELELDAIYLQAKRLKPGSTVPISALRDFVGSLEAHRASKGIFVTTASFSSNAASFCANVSRRVVLIDGQRLTSLMMRHKLGVSVSESYQVKRVDDTYFKNYLQNGAK